MVETKSEFDCEIEAFEAAFKDKKELKLAIYGTGRMTATLLGRLEGFRIVGLLDRDTAMVGREMYGVKVLSQEEAEKKADIVVINTSETYWGTIYQRIRNWNIPVYFRNGERATKDYFHENVDEPYWKKNYADLRAKIQNYELVSFDVFDTLIMRKFYLQTFVFFLVVNNFQEELGDAFSFVEVRKKAAGLLDHATIDEIYDEIEKTEKWGAGLKEKVKQYEVATEKRMILPRRDMVALYQEMKDTKEIFLISDMYLPGDILADILSGCGIDVQRQNILVSCDLKRTKEDGTLWKYYRDHIVKGRRAIHIGDDEKADGEQPQQYGIDSYTVWNANKMLQKSSIRGVETNINTLYASFCAGSISAKMLNSPFSVCGTNGKITFTTEQEAGYCLLGSLSYVFCRWLLRLAKEKKVKQLAFLSREGYLLTKLFRYYCQIVKEKDAPEIVYLETSRRAVLAASIWDKEDIYEVAQFPYIGNIGDFLRDRYGVSVDDKELCTEFLGNSNRDKQELRIILEKYEKKILLEASRERENYLQYLESVGLKSDFAIVDSQLYGTTQFYLGKLFKSKLRGFYFCVCKDKTNKYLEQNIMWGCYPGKEGLDGKDSSVFKNAAFIEAFFTAPYGMLECIEDDGKKRYADKKQNQNHFEVRWEVMEGIQNFMEEAERFCKEYQVNVGAEERYFADKMFEIFMNKGFEPTDKMKNGFYYDNGIASRKEVPIRE